MGTFKEIIAEFGNIDENKESELKCKKEIESLFRVCQRYAGYLDITASAVPVLQNFFEEGQYFTDKKRRKAQKDKIHSNKLDIMAKLHIEFVWMVYQKQYGGIYGKHTEKMFIRELVDNVNYKKNLDKMWDEVFPGGSGDMAAIKDTAKYSINKWKSRETGELRIRDLRLDSLHAVMKKLDRNLESHVDMEESVQRIISEDVLLDILEYLKVKSYPGVLFTVAPVRRALTDGRSKKYFNQDFYYKLSELEQHVDYLRMLLNDYKDTQKDFENSLEEYYKNQGGKIEPKFKVGTVVLDEK